MLNRRHIRVKVMQSIYAFKGSESDDLSKDQKFLLFSIDNMYGLYLLLLSLLIEVQKRAEADLLKKQNKHLATQEDKNPNKKFVNNELLQIIKNNSLLKEKKGMFSGKYAINPITGEEIPIWIGNYVIMSYGNTAS